VIPVDMTSKGLHKLHPDDLERLVRSEEGIRAIPPQLRRNVLAQLTALRRKLEQRTCSQAWFAHCWSTGAEFPPSADTTPMLACDCPRCRRQGRLWPAHYGVPNDSAPSAAAAGDELVSADRLPAARELSYECYLESLSDWEAAHLPSSPSGMALRAVREGRIKIRRQRTRLGRSRKPVF
jgi:hypothetical protein